MLTTTADHALRAVLYLARLFGQRVAPVGEIASAIGAPQNYLGKTLNALVKQGIVTSARGPGGGFALAIPPEQLLLSDVVDSFLTPIEQANCLLGDRPCDARKLCAAHERWMMISGVKRAALASMTIAQLTGAE